MKAFWCTLLTFFFIAPCSMAEKPWNQFRGPDGNGKTTATNLPIEFNETKNVRWKTPIHDQGWSSPVVWGNQIWLTTALESGKELFAICVDRESGKIIHDIKVFDVDEPQMTMPQMNTHASPTPIIEEGRVYIHFGSYGTACLDTKTGKKIWERRDLNCDHRVRAGSSPIIDGDLLFLTYDGIDIKFIAALDKHTGETVWIRTEISTPNLSAHRRFRRPKTTPKPMRNIKPSLKQVKKLTTPPKPSLRQRLSNTKAKNS